MPRQLFILKASPPSPGIMKHTHAGSYKKCAFVAHFRSFVTTAAQFRPFPEVSGRE
jgi:hypothetical protein